uniref:Mitochondrial Rho GTPase n=1 Tax=Syphacia muris TaxID=451379 RepID=A0A158R4B8_9BILA
MNRKDRSVADVRVLLIGEPGVGKTSLIVALLEDEFLSTVPPRINNVTIPPDVTPENIVTSIHDYCGYLKQSYGMEQNNDELTQEIMDANVICVVYSVDDQTSIDKVTSYWLPLVQKMKSAANAAFCPVILVGNKADEPSSSSQLQKVLPIMNDFDEIETCVECSAKTMRNISEIFYYAQKAVLYPTRQLYMPETRELTRICRKALMRIFKLCDFDNDGLLNDHELNQFQVLVFDLPMNAVAAANVKAAISSRCDGGIIEGSVTLSGFIYLHQLFIHLGRHETTWKVLRRFGYDDNLQLAPEYISPAITVPKGCTTELTFEGLQFVTALFEKYDEDGDGCLSPTELQNLFSVCPTNPWSKEFNYSVETNSKGWITYNGYLCYWIMTTFLDIAHALELLAYLGFQMRHESQLDAITRDKRIDYTEKFTARNVFQCHVIGPKNAGKTAFVHSFVGCSLAEVAAINKKLLNSYAINSTKVKDETRYLLLHEVDVISTEEMLTSYEKSADVVVFLYDASNPNSFSYSANIYLKYFYRTKVPCVVVATKVECFQPEQNYEQQPADFCQAHGLPQPLRFRLEDIGKTDSSVYSQLATMAAYPHLKRVYFLQDASLMAKITFGAALAALAGFLLYKNI